MGRLSDVINYSKINESNKEFRRTDYWLIEITPPPGTYFPGNELIQIRTSAFSTGISDDPDVEEKNIRGFTVKQGKRPTSLAGEMSITLTDRVDQTLSYFIDMWKLAIADRDRLQGGSKEMTFAPTIKAMYFNIHEEKIREITFINCVLKSASLPEDGENDPGIEGDISMTISYEHFKRTFLNLPLLR